MAKEMPKESSKETTLASGLRFPEGPIALPDGRVLVVEIARGTLSVVDTDGVVGVVAELGGGPNGAAMGPMVIVMYATTVASSGSNKAASSTQESNPKTTQVVASSG